MIALDQESMELLQKVQNQKSPAVYAPQAGDLVGFQVQAEKLLFLRDVGFIELAFEPSRESKSGHQYIDCVAVRNITPRGNRALAEGG